MSTPAGDEPPFALDGTVSRDKLLELLAVQAELAWLDYKSECDLNATADTVAIAKDVGAMRIRTGYLVIGADNAGVPVGISEAHAKLFDEATLRPKLARYVGPSGELRTAVHDLDDGTGPMRLALIWVGPHPDGLCIFTSDGQYADQHNRPKIEFRKGDVYARHGTSSEPWNQADIRVVLAALVAREKDSWRAEHAEQTRLLLQAAAAQTSAVTGPAAAFTWELDEAGFEAATVELIRRDDDVPVRLMLRKARADAERLLQTDSGDASADLLVLLDRITTVAALSLGLGRTAYLAHALDTMLGLYDLGITRQNTNAAGQRSEWLWLRLAERFYALGALAVRLRDWSSVRQLVLAPLANLHPEQRHDRTWHRHALTNASHAKLLEEDTPNGLKRHSLLMFVRAVVAANPALRPDLPGPVDPEPSGRDPLLTSACQFDFLVTLISGIGAADQNDLLDVSYPHYARYYSSRVHPIAAALATDTAIRAALIPGTTDAQLALVLHLADQLARAVARSVHVFSGWNGYDDTVAAFVAAALHP